MRDALIALGVLGIFGRFKKEKAGANAVQRGPIVKLEMPQGPLTPPAAPPEEKMDPLRRDLRFKGLHADVNPSQSVRPGEMKCTQCDRTFRYFSNSNGVTTNVRCPGCAKTYRV